MLMHHSQKKLHQHGFGLFAILLAIALFAALSYAISRIGSGTNNLSAERINIIAAEIIDTGNKISDAAGKLRLRRINPVNISFENMSVAGYVTGCADDECRIFAYDGGGLEWPRPPANANNGENWGFTGNVRITDIGTDNAELLAVLPNISLDVCTRINVLLGIHDAATAPSSIAAVAVSKFTGTYNDAGPSVINTAQTLGKKSACLQVTALTGNAIDGTPLTNAYTYYHVLLER